MDEVHTICNTSFDPAWSIDTSFQESRKIAAEAGIVLFDRTSPLLSLPFELQEQIFEQTMIDNDPTTWDWLGDFHGSQDEICLLPSNMRPPALAQVSRTLRRNMLVFLFRTSTFRVELDLERGLSAPPRALLSARTEGMSWLGLLDKSQCGIRRLQVRLPIPDSRGRCANLNLLYKVYPGKGWQIELVADRTFDSDDDPDSHRTRWYDRPKPESFEIGILMGLLKVDTQHADGDVQGLDWIAVARVLRMVDMWFAVDEKVFVYEEFRQTVILDRKGCGRVLFACEEAAPTAFGRYKDAVPPAIRK